MSKSQQIILSDLSKCTPSDRLSRRMTRSKWRLVDYETEDLAGTMIFPSGDGPAEPLTLRLEATGWHDIHVAFPHGIGWGCPSIKLTDDPCLWPIAKDPPPYWGPKM